ncbi:hypothetical protein FisN_10Hu347 [Fistulifera solaris]|uniref:Uncharacterized protein n=1 Tax=Fistulifera solaris TaxID=1519565 RepID=A0A1Z5JRM2_FISSO|nr:hypothetical protein FisN_10Hu347 [Fistulifera solaris]|eukprot:GAX16411.1 hypothetical protein FisN_10Hu347 [Fistulifera solaris]
MRFLLSTLALLGFANLAYAQLPPTLTIGNVNDVLTEFNVGEGNTDETTSLNHIQIAATAGTDVEISNNPGPNPPAGTKYYEFTILPPGCLAAGDGAVTVKTSYDQDGHLTALNTVDMELAVAPWGTSVHAVEGKFGVCIQADIMMINAALEAVVLERKHFDFRVTPILSTFTVTQLMLADQRPSNPVQRLAVDDQDYNFVEFETVTMKIGAAPATNLITATVPVDSALTSFELGATPKTINFYHILPRSAFGATSQTLTMTGKALVDYVGPIRRLRGTEDRELATEPVTTDFSMEAVMLADEGGDSGSFKIEIVSLVIGGVGVIGAALL